MRSKVDLKPKIKKLKVIEVENISDEDKSVWFIWIGLVFIAIAALPFIAALSLAEVPFFIEVQLWLTLCCIGVPICTIASKQLGGQKDPSSIILDEFAAMPLVLLVVPAQQRTWLIMLLAFLLFRLFDIMKPPPCQQLENLPNGAGIMADDLAAAGLVAGTLFVITTPATLPCAAHSAILNFISHSCN